MSLSERVGLPTCTKPSSYTVSAKVLRKQTMGPSFVSALSGQNIFGRSRPVSTSTSLTVCNVETLELKAESGAPRRASLEIKNAIQNRILTVVSARKTRTITPTPIQALARMELGVSSSRRTTGPSWSYVSTPPTVWPCMRMRNSEKRSHFCHRWPSPLRESPCWPHQGNPLLYCLIVRPDPCR